MKNIVMGVLMFAIGWVAASLVGIAMLPVETPSGGSVEQFSPSDWVKQEQIKMNSHQVTIMIDNAQIAKFANTNSMDPLLDENTHGIEIRPEKPQDIHVGDVVSYRSGSEIIIHRVIAVYIDEDGYYYTLKGDNNAVEDPEQIRFEDIERVLVGVIY